MRLSLKESKAIIDIADLLYSFLPGSGHPSWKGHVNFQTVASEVGVGDYWPGGSKRPAIIALLERTFEHRSIRFEALILRIVHRGLVYRKKQGAPVTAEEIDALYGHLLELNFKYPDLWKPDFRASLQPGYGARVKEQVEQIFAGQQKSLERSGKLAKLRPELALAQTENDRSAAGYRFEKLLSDLLDIFDLSPRRPFRVVGEEIDGSFELDYESYLLEAKAVREPLAEAHLLVFRGKIEGKTGFTRGVLFALNGVSKSASDAIRTGKQPNFFVVNGYDLMMILSEEIGLVEYLRQRRRLLAEEGLVVVPFGDLWSGSRQR